MGPPSYTRSVVDRNVVMRRMTVVPPLCYLAGNMHSPDRLLSTVHLVRTAGFLDAKRSREQDVHNGLSRICIVPFVRHTREFARQSNRWWGENMGTLFYQTIVACVTHVCEPNEKKKIQDDVTNKCVWSFICSLFNDAVE
jgi:hypothetical protein